MLRIPSRSKKDFNEFPSMNGSSRDIPDDIAAWRRRLFLEQQLRHLCLETLRLVVRAGCLRQSRHFCESSHVMCGHRDPFPRRQDCPRNLQITAPISNISSSKRDIASFCTRSSLRYRCDRACVDDCGERRTLRSAASQWAICFAVLLGGPFPGAVLVHRRPQIQAFLKPLGSENSPNDLESAKLISGLKATCHGR